jgi:O-antigen/teichoic acid export membrane protein
MERDIKNKAISGISWNIFTRIGGQILQFGTLIVLTRLLQPKDFGLVGMVTVFIGFAKIFIDLGFGDALIQRSHADDRYFSTVFWLNVVMGMFLSTLFFFIAPRYLSSITTHYITHCKGACFPFSCEFS